MPNKQSQQIGLKNAQVIRWQPAKQPFYEMLEDNLAAEMPVALVYNGISHVVMMATPQHLEHFALGFSLSEGIIRSVNDIYGIDVVAVSGGIEVHIELSSRCFMALKQQRRNLAGRTGCGVCGSEQLTQVLKPLPQLAFTQSIDLQVLKQALPRLRDFQPIGQLTGCTHGAGWIDNHGQLQMGFEDIGRHVALDKLLGAYHQTKKQGGALLVSSRASYEMVQKSILCGMEILIAASAATQLAVDIANTHGLTLIGFSKASGAVIYTHPQRIVGMG